MGKVKEMDPGFGVVGLGVNGDKLAELEERVLRLEQQVDDHEDVGFKYGKTLEKIIELQDQAQSAWNQVSILRDENKRHLEHIRVLTQKLEGC